MRVENFAQNFTQTSPLIISLLVFSLYRWSQWHQDEAVSLAPLVRQRNNSALVGLLGCFTLSLTAFLPSSLLSQILERISAVIGLGLYFSYLQLDPTKIGFWYHRRMRPIGIAFGLLASLILGAVGIDQSIAALIFAVAIYQRHQKFSQILVGDLLRMQESLRKKILSLEVDVMHLSTTEQVPEAVATHHKGRAIGR